MALTRDTLENVFQAQIGEGAGQRSWADLCVEDGDSLMTADEKFEVASTTTGSGSEVPESLNNSLEVGSQCSTPELTNQEAKVTQQSRKQSGKQPRDIPEVPKEEVLKLMVDVECGTALPCELRDLAFKDLRGSKKVQDLAELAAKNRNHKVARAISSAFHGWVWQAMMHETANYVLLKILDWLPLCSSFFMCLELWANKENICSAAQHRAACRLLRDVFIKHHTSEVVYWLAWEVLKFAPSLCLHQYGTHVINSIVANFHCFHELHEQIITCLVQAKGADGFAKVATSISGSLVLEELFRHCNEAVGDRLVAYLMPHLNTLICNQRCGCRVLKTMVEKGHCLPQTENEIYKIAMLQNKQPKNMKLVLDAIHESGARRHARAWFAPMPAQSTPLTFQLQ